MNCYKSIVCLDKLLYNYVYIHFNEYIAVLLSYDNLKESGTDLNIFLIL